MKQSEIISAWAYAWNQWSYRLHVRGFTIEEREDLLGEATVMALIALPSFRRRSKLSTFFFKVFQTTIYRSFRIKKLRLKTEKRYALDWAIPAYIANENGIEELPSILADMNSVQRHILIMRDVEGRSYDHLAKILGIPRGTVMSRLHNARKGFRLSYFKQQFGKVG